MQTKCWTPRELLHITDNYLTQTDAAMAEHLGRSAGAVGLMRCRRLKLFRKWSDDEMQILTNGVDKTAVELAAMLPGRTVKAIEQKRWRMNHLTKPSK